jgi:hypothetical protein
MSPSLRVIVVCAALVTWLPAQAQFLGPGLETGAIARPYRAVDTLAVMQRRGAITVDMPARDCRSSN